MPPLYQRWLLELLPGAPPRETQAQCSTCPMVAPERGVIAETQVGFHANVKCCTYVPRLANFSVGQIIQSDGLNPARLDGLHQRLRVDVYMTPLALLQPASYRLLRNGAGSFGRAMGLRCPHYVLGTGQCGIWQFRNAVCSTWFCKHVRGQTGYRFWQCVRAFLELMERRASLFCARVLGISASDLAYLVEYESQDDAVLAGLELCGCAESRLRKAWAQWVGQETDYYVRCAEIAAAISPRKLLSEGGDEELRLRAGAMQQAFSDLRDDRPPKAPIAMPVQVRTHGREEVEVATYSLYDPVLMPRAIIDALGVFDGRPLEAALRSLQEDYGYVMDRELVLRLLDFGLVQDTGPWPAAGQE